MADFSVGADSVRSNPTRFDRALSRYIYAYERTNNDPDDSDERSDYLTDALVQAEERLMAVPAADLEELRVKADIIWTDLDSIAPGYALLAFFADLRRLTGDKPSAVFDPAPWLARFERRGGMWAVQDSKALLLFPDGADLDDVMNELDLRGGKPAVLDLILARHAAKEA